MTRCQRCSAPCRVNPDRNPDARLMRRSTSEGLCANCAMTDFLKTMEPLSTVISTKGPEILLNPAVQRQVAAVLAAGEADAEPSEIDWTAVVGQWDFAATGGTQ